MINYLEHHSETAALCGIFALLSMVDWLTHVLASVIVSFFGG